MRRTTTLATLFAWMMMGASTKMTGGVAQAQAGAAAAPTPTSSGQPVAEASPAPNERKLQVGLSFLPMGMGKYIYSPDAASAPVKSDASFAYGVGLSAGYEIIPHLVVGVAPQVIFNVVEKAPEIASQAVRQYDVMARVAYVLPVAAGTSVFAEALPGFSLITNEAGSKGFVLAVGVGATVDVSERVFVSLAGGYQVGFQSWKAGSNTFQTRTRYVRAALGAGMRF
jgi:hypothetical protein